MRLFGPWPLATGAEITTENEQAHHLVHVMRARKGMEIALFNGRDGEWLAEVTDINRKQCVLTVKNPLRPQAPEATDAWLLFAAIKRLRIDFVAEKACELGVSVLWPLFTRHAAMTWVNTDRLARPWDRRGRTVRPPDGARDPSGGGAGRGPGRLAGRPALDRVL